MLLFMVSSVGIFWKTYFQRIFPAFFVVVNNNKLFIIARTSSNFSPLVLWSYVAEVWLNNCTLLLKFPHHFSFCCLCWFVCLLCGAGAVMVSEVKLRSSRLGHIVPLPSERPHCPPTPGDLNIPQNCFCVWELGLKKFVLWWLLSTVTLKPCALTALLVSCCHWADTPSGIFHLLACILSEVQFFYSIT